jgi:hypothetical protein
MVGSLISSRCLTRSGVRPWPWHARGVRRDGPPIGRLLNARFTAQITGAQNLLTMAIRALAVGAAYTRALDAGTAGTLAVASR